VYRPGGPGTRTGTRRKADMENPDTSQQENGEELTDREEGGPTSPAQEPEEDVTGGGPSKDPEEGGFDAHE
jgi:hypothetical protein